MSQQKPKGKESVTTSAIRKCTRRQFIGLTLAGGVGVAGASLFTACAQPAPPTATTAPAAGPAATAAPAAGASKTLVVGVSIDDIVSLDPHRAMEVIYPVFDHACYETLVTYENNDFSKPLPALATSWDVSSDAKVYTFKLRQGVKFASGNPMTSDDVKWSYERLINLKGQPAFFLDSLDKVEAPDAQTVKVTLKQSDASFLAAITAPPVAIIDRKTAEAHGATAAADAGKTDKAEQWLTSNSIGTGPYVITQYTAKGQVQLKRNQNAWKPAKYFDEVLVKGVPDAGTQQLMLQKGDIDLAGNLQPEHIQALKGNKDVAVASTPSTDVAYLGMTRDPKKNEALAKPEVGQAIRAAIDYEGLKALVPGSVRDAFIVTSGLAGSLPVSEAPATDLNKAKELLTKAGYPNGFKAKLNVSATMVRAGAKIVNIAQKVQADLAKVGIQIELVTAEDNVWRDGFKAGAHEMTITGYFMDYPDTSNYLAVFLPDGLMAKRMGYTLDKDTQGLVPLLQKALATPDESKRLPMYQDIQRKILADGPWAALIEPLMSYAHRADIKGVLAEPTYYFSPQNFYR
ncbi:MAG: ABC transporter substrate-binding protein [Chloroflexi bacterium]|nr:ABC transporter substrate-binding protein [Chloroflexota bacterium]